MLEKLYFAVWALYIMTLGAFYFTGNLTPLVEVVFGFVFFGITFMGMIGILPFHVTHHPEPKH